MSWFWSWQFYKTIFLSGTAANSTTVKSTPVTYGFHMSCFFKGNLSAEERKGMGTQEKPKKQFKPSLLASNPQQAYNILMNLDDKYEMNASSATESNMPDL